MHARVLAAAMIVLGLAPAARSDARAQSADSTSSLVVVIPNDEQFHQPACPLVAKAGSRVKVMRRGEAERRGLTPHDCQAAIGRGGAPSASEANALTVYVQAGDNKYHRAGCSKLKPNATRITLEEAGKKYWPCPVCKPPVRKNPKGSQQ